MTDQHPQRSTLDWAASVVASKIVSWHGLREAANPWLLSFDSGDQAVLRLAPPEYRHLQRTELAALELARLHGIPVPQLLGADVDGLGAILIGAVAGRSTIPKQLVPARLHALGVAAAALHAVPLEPRTELPVRTRPIEGVDFAAMRRRDGTTDLLARAEELVARLPRPAGAVFVHGDLWQGNVLWSAEDTLLAIIDWDCAGSGHPGVDLGCLRLDAALLYGLPAAELPTAGWAAATGREPEHVAYWDAVAALSSPTDLSYFVQAMAGQGRDDIDRATAVARRDSFLEAALRQLG
jgi:aminoglycoside phosphotransferase (APT) family kinase protein